MAVDNMPGEIAVKKRDEVAEDWRRSVKVRNPSEDVGPGSQADLDARTFADQTGILYSNAQAIGNAITSKNRSGDALDEDGEKRGVTRRPEIGAIGYVEISASASGGTILAGDELTEPNSSLRYQCMATALYDDGEYCPVAGIDTGPSTNQDAGTVLQWSSPRPGISPTCVVTEASDGTGLSGGANVEPDDIYRERIDDVKANQPAAGNDAEYQRAILETPGVRVEAAFTYPATLGPGTTGFTFTIPPASAGANRIPSAAQMALVYAYLVGKFPADDSIFQVALTALERDVSIDVEWADGAVGWANTAPWPGYFELGVAPGASGGVVVSVGTDATNFTLDTDNTDYSTCGDPVVGTVLGVWDAPNATFRRKEVLTAAGGGPWVIACATADGVSDLSYTPIAGQRVCPWSDSLDLAAAPIISFFETLGPGECVAAFTDIGRREKRSPTSPGAWPHTISEARLIRGVHDVSAVLDASLLEGDAALTVGTAGVLAYLFEPRYLSIFAG